jgi:hypothetical protein
MFQKAKFFNNIQGKVSALVNEKSLEEISDLQKMFPVATRFKDKKVQQEKTNLETATEEIPS